MNIHHSHSLDAWVGLATAGSGGEGGYGGDGWGHYWCCYWFDTSFQVVMAGVWGDAR